MHFLSFFLHQAESTGRVIICDCLEPGTLGEQLLKKLPL